MIPDATHHVLVLRSQEEIQSRWWPAWKPRAIDTGAWTSDENGWMRVLVDFVEGAANPILPTDAGRNHAMCVMRRRVRNARAASHRSTTRGTQRINDPHRTLTLLPPSKRPRSPPPHRHHLDAHPPTHDPTQPTHHRPIQPAAVRSSQQQQAQSWSLAQVAAHPHLRRTSTPPTTHEASHSRSSRSKQPWRSRRPRAARSPPRSTSANSRRASGACLRECAAAPTITLAAAATHDT